MSSRWISTEQKGTHSYHREDDADGAEDGLGWRDVREFFREIQALYDHIQRKEGGVSTFRLLGLWVHGFEVEARAQGRCIGNAAGKAMDPD